MKTRVVTASVDASVAGQRLAVNGFTITLGVNSIPSIELQCAPSKTGDNTPLKPNVKRPSISDFSDMYRDLAVKAEGLYERGDVKINIKDNYGNAESISLNGWVLAGVGMSSVDASSAPYLSVILKHPICKLTKVGSVYETAKTVLDQKLNEVTKGKNNFLEIVTAVYKCVRESVAFWPMPKGGKYATNFRKMLGTGEFDPNRYLEWGGTDGIFLGGFNEESKVRLAQAMGRLALPDNGGSSTWDMLVNASGSLLLSITQDESYNYTTDKLLLEPTEPWKIATINLYDHACFSTEIPGMDPFKITGVMCRKLGPYNGNINLGNIRNANPNHEDPVAYVIYVPDGVDIKKADGRIMMTSAPAVLDSAFRRDAAYGKALSLGKIYNQKLAADNYNGIIAKYCKAIYEITAASMIQAKAQMSMWFKDWDGNLILPGNTCRFISDGKVIYYGYAKQVVHYMSTSGGCSTTVSMSYVRPEADFKIGGSVAIASGSINEAYA